MIDIIYTKHQSDIIDTMHQSPNLNSVTECLERGQGLFIKPGPACLSECLQLQGPKHTGSQYIQFEYQNRHSIKKLSMLSPVEVKSGPVIVGDDSAKNKTTIPIGIIELTTLK